MNKKEQDSIDHLKKVAIEFKDKGLVLEQLYHFPDQNSAAIMIGGGLGFVHVSKDESGKVSIRVIENNGKSNYMLAINPL